MLKRVCAWAKAQEELRVLILTGLYAQGSADELSDLDLEMFASAPATYTQSDRWMSEIGTVWCYLSLHNERGLPTRLVEFDGGVKADFTICPVSERRFVGHDGPGCAGLEPGCDDTLV